MNISENSPRRSQPLPSPFQAPEAAALTPGSLIQHYELIRELGRGGMGTVYLARDTRLGRRVAIKFLHTQDADIARRFLLEARATALCSHENIVIIHEVGECEHGPFMVLEYLQGQPLKKLLAHQRLPPVRAVELMLPVVRALQCAHEQGIVHRDLKPDNIFVTESGALKVLDFGIAKVLQGDEAPVKPEGTFVGALLDDGKGDITRQGMLLGTMAFMAPEQWGNGVSIDHRADIWAVGIMLFRMLSGQHPLGSLGGAQLAVIGLLDEPMPRLRDVASHVPADLAAVVDRCLLKRKEERFPDAASLLRALEPLVPGRYPREPRIDARPYAGLSSFQESDADRFFGRTREIAALVHRLQDQQLMAVVGPSGTGKSSLVRAGLVPMLKRSGGDWEALVIRPGRSPLSALANIVAPLVNSSDSIEGDLAEQQKMVERLRAEPGYVGGVLRSHARRGKKKLLLFVDQFEELYTLVPDAAERRAFTACLSDIADDATSPIRVILSLRSDFLDRVPEDERFMGGLSQGLYFLTLPQNDGLRDALVHPVEMAGYRFESPVLVDNILRDLANAQGSLPLLQLVATRLWEARDSEHKQLSVETYESMGGLAGALANHADSVLAALSSQERNLARALFLRLVTPERTCASVPMDVLRALTRAAPETQRLIDLLIQARLLTVHMESGGTGATVELVHASLLNGWPKLEQWLDEDQQDKETKKGKRLKRSLLLGGMTLLVLTLSAGVVPRVIRQSQRETAPQTAAKEVAPHDIVEKAHDVEPEAPAPPAVSRVEEQARQPAQHGNEVVNKPLSLASAELPRKTDEPGAMSHETQKEQRRVHAVSRRTPGIERKVLKTEEKARYPAEEPANTMSREKDDAPRQVKRQSPSHVLDLK